MTRRNSSLVLFFLAVVAGFVGCVPLPPSDSTGQCSPETAALPPTTPPEAARQPVIVLVEHNPWLMVIGSDSPTFALYDDGLVIYLARTPEDRRIYLWTTLGKESLDRLLASLPSDKSFAALRDDYAASDLTDQPTNVISRWIDGHRRSVTVYGNLRHVREARWRTPPAFLKLYDSLITFSDAEARPWLPALIEVMFWPYEYAPQPSAPWPVDWPDLKSPDALRRREESWSVFLPSARFDDLKRFRENLGQQQAVRINGRKMALAWRLPFPAESAWMK
jgi:hypothetical protein